MLPPEKIEQAKATQICASCTIRKLDECEITPCSIREGLALECPQGLWNLNKKERPLKKEIITTRNAPEEKPYRHKAWGKPIFYRGEGHVVDLVDLYHGQDVFLVGGGPSLKDVDMRTLRDTPGVLTMGMNNVSHNYRTDMWTGQDPQYKFMESIWMDPSVMKFTLLDYRKRAIWDRKKGGHSDTRTWQCPNTFFHKRHSKFEADKWFEEQCVVWGRPKEKGGSRSVFLAALHILWFLGFRNIFLLGVDFHMSVENRYAFDESRKGSTIRGNNSLYENISRYCEELQPSMQAQDFNVFNCNPDSHLKVFPQKNLRDAIEMCRIDVSQSTEGMYVKR